MTRNKEDFKKDISDALFVATKTKELSIERVLEIADKIADRVYKSASELVITQATKWLNRQERYSIVNNILNEQVKVDNFIYDLSLEIR